MKFGLLACGFDCSENIDKVLEAWNTLKQDKSFTLKSLTYSKMLKRLQLKIYDTTSKKNKSLDVEAVTSIKRMAT